MNIVPATLHLRHNVLIQWKILLEHGNYILCRRQPRYLLFSLNNNNAVVRTMSLSVTDPSPSDPHSRANPADWRVKHINLKLKAVFKAKILCGSAELTVRRERSEADNWLVLDSSGLVLNSIHDSNSGETLKYELSEPDPILGSELKIELPRECSEEAKVFISYETSPDASALLWLPPEQTHGKKHPYLLSLCHPIHCRSMVPLQACVDKLFALKNHIRVSPVQDTPSVKLTYNAEISAPEELTVAMGALSREEPEVISGEMRKFYFSQPIPIPSYLIALAIGQFSKKKIGEDCHVWAEDGILEQAASQFDDTAAMLKIAKDLCGTFVWGVYDILVLPASFPHGGMENPCLTFVTPTLLTGDKSLSNVIAHEIVHSWTGNLVTNTNASHFWLNEGFTKFIERKIIGKMKGEKERHLQSFDGYSKLEEEITELGKDSPLTALVPKLDGIHPDMAFSKVPYEKGSLFLWYLEELVGGPDIFEPFLKSYYDKFMYKSINSIDFKDFLESYFNNKPKIAQIDWNSWFFGTGMPAYKPNYDRSLIQACYDLRDKWLQWQEDPEKEVDEEHFHKMSPTQKLAFLAILCHEESPSLKHNTLEELNKKYHFSEARNSEMRFKWAQLGLMARWKPAAELALQMVTESGKLSYLRQLYRKLYAWEEMRPITLQTFEKHKNFYMSITRQCVMEVLQLKK